MMPVIAYNVLHASQILANAMRVLATKCIHGMEANSEQCAYWLERSAALATALAPQIGYARAAEISKESVKLNVLIRDLVKQKKILSDAEADEILDLRKMTEIGVPGGEHGMKGAG
jgi:aspartate ammonia-lyase